MKIEMRVSREVAEALVRSQKANAEAQLKDFSAKVAKNPSYALEWAQDEFKASATLDVTSTVLHWFSHEPLSLEDITRNLLDSLLRSATPGESTSPCSNLIHAYRVAAKAELLREFMDLD